ncbi:hypothetical protein WA577_001363, partial [Blastocystis sp. JDR]
MARVLAKLRLRFCIQLLHTGFALPGAVTLWKKMKELILECMSMHEESVDTLCCRCMASLLVPLARFYHQAEQYTGNPVLQNWCLQNVEMVNAAYTECIQWITEMTKKECLYINSQERMELMAIIQFLLMNQFQQTGFLPSVATVLDFFSSTACKSAFYNSLPAIRQLP